MIYARYFSIFFLIGNKCVKKLIYKYKTFVASGHSVHSSVPACACACHVCDIWKGMILTYDHSQRLDGCFACLSGRIACLGNLFHRI